MGNKPHKIHSHSKCNFEIHENQIFNQKHPLQIPKYGALK